MAKKKEKKVVDYKKGWKIIFEELKGHKRLALFISIFIVLMAIASSIIPWVYGKFIDELAVQTTFFDGSQFAVASALAFASGWILLGVVQELFGGIHVYYERLLGTRIEYTYRARLYQRLLRLPVYFFNNNKVGSVISKIKDASSALDVVIVRAVLRQAPDLLNILIALVVTLTVSVKMSLVMYGGLILFVIFVFWRMQKREPLNKRFQDERHRINGKIMDLLYNIPLIKENTAEDRSHKIFEKALLGKFFSYRMDLSRHFAFSGPVWSTIMLLTQGALMIMGFMFIKAGELTIGQLVMFGGYSRQIFYPFVQLAWRWQEIQDGFIALAYSDEIMQHELEPYKGKRGAPKNIKGHVSFEKVKFSYKEDVKKKKDIKGGSNIESSEDKKKKMTALNGVSFEVKPGESIALVGASGSGKSTCISLLTGAYFAEDGKVLVDGISVSDHSLRVLRSAIAIVPQDVTLLNASVKENIMFGVKKASMKKLEDAARKAYALDFIKEFPNGWDQEVGERGVKLSGGQKQRIAIARAILRDPQILILDEPTSALDAESEFHITKALDKLMKGRTTFIIAHRLSTVRRADNILILDKGKVVEYGSHDDLLKQDGMFKHLHDLQFGLHE